MYFEGSRQVSRNPHEGFRLERLKSRIVISCTRPFCLLRGCGTFSALQDVFQWMNLRLGLLQLSAAGEVWKSLPGCSPGLEQQIDY